MAPHQQRVVDEKTALDEKLGALRGFIAHSEIYPKLPDDERARLFRQESCMTGYSDILGERIAAFPPS